jgi:hypothetical protein
VDELAPVSDESDTGGNMGRGGSIGSADELASSGSELDEEEAAEEAAEAAEAAADSSPEDDDKVPQIVVLPYMPVRCSALQSPSLPTSLAWVPWLGNQPAPPCCSKSSACLQLDTVRG